MVLFWHAVAGCAHALFIILFSFVSDMRGMSTSACLHGTVVKTDVLYLGLIYDRPLTGQP